jgi:hypothetical protein
MCELHTQEAQLYLELVMSLLQPFDKYVETILQRDKVTVLLFDEYIDVRYDGNDVFIHVPWVIGTKLWTYRKKYCRTSLTKERYKEITWEEYLPIGSLEEEFSICWLCNQHDILLSFKIDHVLYVTASFFLLDHIRPRTAANKECFNYYNNEKHIVPSNFRNSIFALYPYKIVTYSQILIRYIDQPLIYFARGTGDLKQNQQNRLQLRRGQVDTFISARTHFQSTAEDNNNPSATNKNFEGTQHTFSPLSERNRYTVAQSTIVDLRQPKIISLAPTNTWIASHRLIRRIERGLIDPSKVTETNRAGQQKLLSLGVCFPHWREDDPWTYMVRCIDELDIGEGKYVTVIEGYTFRLMKLWLPKSKYDLLQLILELFARFKLTVDIVGNEIDDSPIKYYIYPSYYVPVVSSRHNVKFKLSLYSKMFFEDCWHFIPTYFSLLSLGCPFYNRSHLAKVFQAITKMSSTILPQSALRVEGNKVIHHYADEASNSNLPGSPINNPIHVHTRAAFKQRILNDEDGDIVSSDWIKKFKMITLKYERIYCGVFKLHEQVCGKHIEPDEVIAIFTCAKTPTKKYQHIVIIEVNGFYIVKRKIIQHDIVDQFVLQNIISDSNQETFLMKFSITYVKEAIIGDKFTSIHGQKVTITEIRDPNDPIFLINGERADVLLSATSEKRMTIGEKLYGYLARTYPNTAKYCFGEKQFHLNINWYDENIDAKVYDLFFIRLSNLATDVLTFTKGPLSSNRVSGQNSKGSKGSHGIITCTKTVTNLSLCPWVLETYLDECNLDDVKYLDHEGKCIASTSTTYTVIGAIEMLQKRTVNIITI